MIDFNKYDALGQKLHPGDVCIRRFKHSGMEFCIYKGVTKGARATGKFGVFITPQGKTSLKLANVVFVFNPFGNRRASTDDINKIIKNYYEG